MWPFVTPPKNIHQLPLSLYNRKNEAIRGCLLPPLSHALSVFSVGHLLGSWACLVGTRCRRPRSRLDPRSTPTSEPSRGRHYCGHRRSFMYRPPSSAGSGGGGDAPVDRSPWGASPAIGRWRIQSRKAVKLSIRPICSLVVDCRRSVFGVSFAWIIGAKHEM